MHRVSLFQINMERNIPIDISRGVCVLLVVVCHTVSFHTFPPIVTFFFNYIFLRGFFAISGYLYYGKKSSDENIRILVKRTFIKLFIPYIGFSILTIVWDGVLAVVFRCKEISPNYFGWDVVKRDIFCMFSGLGIATLWFLPVSFIVYILLVLFFIKDNKKVSGKRMVLLVAVIIVLEILSCLLRNNNIHIVGLAGKIVNEYLDMFQRILYGFAASIAGYLWGAIEKAHERGGKSNNICSCIFPIIYLGQHSLEVMVIHGNFLLAPEKMILKSVLWFNECSDIIQKALLFCINLSTTIIAIQFLNKMKVYRFLMGENV